MHLRVTVLTVRPACCERTVRATDIRPKHTPVHITPLSVIWGIEKLLKCPYVCSCCASLHCEAHACAESAVSHRACTHNFNLSSCAYISSAACAPNQGAGTGQLVSVRLCLQALSWAYG